MKSRMGERGTQGRREDEEEDTREKGGGGGGRRRRRTQGRKGRRISKDRCMFHSIGSKI